MRKTIIQKDDKGFTLVELIVSAGIIGLTIFVLVGVIRKGNEIAVTNVHAQRAHAILDSCLENSKFHYSNYANLAASVAANVNEPVESIVIDPRGTRADLIGTLSKTIVTGTDLSAGTGGKDPVPYLRITVRISWPEAQDVQTDSLVKIITKLVL